MDVQDVLGLLLRSEIKVGVVLEVKADQVGNRILGRPGNVRRNVLALLDDAVAQIALAIFLTG